jgi:hypothetical protein
MGLALWESGQFPNNEARSGRRDFLHIPRCLKGGSFRFC